MAARRSSVRWPLVRLDHRARAALQLAALGVAGRVPRGGRSRPRGAAPGVFRRSARWRIRSTGFFDIASSKTSTDTNLMIDCIAGYHLNPWTCGIAKFNAILAKHLDVPVVGIRAVELGSYRRPLLSLKLSEFTARDAADLDLWGSAHRGQFELFLHAFDGTEVEQRLVAAAARVYCGNTRALPRAAAAAARRPGAVLPGHDPEPAAVPADRAVGVHLRHGAQDPRAALPPAARSARGHRAELFGLRLDGAAREHELRRLVRRARSRSCSRSSTARSTSWATCPTPRSSTT